MYGDEVASGEAILNVERFQNDYDEPLYKATFTIDGTVAADVTYWLTLTNAYDVRSAVYWNMVDGPSEAAMRFEGTAGPGSSIPSESFRLYGDMKSVPEPGSLVLLGLGLAGATVLQRRRKTTAI